MDSEKTLEEISKMPYEVVADRALTTQDHLFKLIIIGDTGVGKSCLMKRIMDNEFKQEHQVTIGVEFGSFGLKIDGKIIKLQIWDTAGQESFKSVTRIFYRGAHCVFLTYDVTREDTFVNLSQWLSEVKQHATEDVRVYMVGNKGDIEDQREVTHERALEMAKANKIHRVFETSAKTGANVEELFATVARELYIQAKQELEAPRSTVPAPPGCGGIIIGEDKDKKK